MSERQARSGVIAAERWSAQLRRTAVSVYIFMSFCIFGPLLGFLFISLFAEAPFAFWLFIFSREALLGPLLIIWVPAMIFGGYQGYIGAALAGDFYRELGTVPFFPILRASVYVGAVASIILFSAMIINNRVSSDYYNDLIYMLIFWAAHIFSALIGWLIILPLTRTSKKLPEAS